MGVASAGVWARLHLSALGNVHLSSADDAVLATALVQRALSPSRADAFKDWYAVGAALFAAGRELFAVWDSFSQSCPAKYDAKACETLWKGFNGTSSIGKLARDELSKGETRKDAPAERAPTWVGLAIALRDD